MRGFFRSHSYHGHGVSSGSGQYDSTFFIILICLFFVYALFWLWSKTRRPE